MESKLLEDLIKEISKLRDEANREAMLSRFDIPNHNFYFGRKMAFVDVLNILKRELYHEEN